MWLNGVFDIPALGTDSKRRQKTIAIDYILHGPGRRERLVITEIHNTLSLSICTWKNNEIIMDKYDAKCVYGVACFINMEHCREIKLHLLILKSL